MSDTQRNIPRIAVVTGANKGIGYAVAADLCAKFKGIVYLTARNVDLGKVAVANLKKDGFDPHFHQLDVDDPSSIKTFGQYLKDKYDGLDVLINNAAIAYKGNSTAPFSEQAEVTVRVNYFGLLNVCKELFPLLRPHARVVNVSSSVSMLKNISDPLVRNRFTYADLSENELSEIMNEFVTDAKNGTHVQKGWSTSAYSMSKIGVTALTIIQQKIFDKDEREDIIVNAVHPGYVDTDMTSHKGPLTTSEGADPIVYLALLQPNVSFPKGKFVWNDKSVVEWAPVPLPQRA